MGLNELIVGPIYIVLAVWVLFLIRPYFTNQRNKRFFIPAFLVKVLGLLFFTYIYAFYYQGGDTLTYYEGAKVISDVFFDAPWVFFQGLFTDAADYASPIVPFIAGKVYYFKNTEEWTIIRIAGFFGVFAFKSYLGISIIMSFIVFLSMWRLYNAFGSQYPEIENTLGIFILFAPSSVFWGSAIMKDTVAFGCSCYIVACILDLMNGRGNWLRDSIIILISIKLLLLLKVYLLLCIVPALGTWWLIKTWRKIKSIALKILIIPFLIILGIGAVGGGLAIISAQSSDFNSVDRASQALQGYHFDHGGRRDASTYTLGEVEYTPLGILKKAPESLIVTLFRPFPFEIRNLIMVMASVESTIYLLLTFFVLFKRGVLNIFRNSFTNPLAGLSIVFTIILGFIVGISSYNFGALVRFKIPLLPFYGAWLVLMYYLPKYEERIKFLKNKSKKAEINI